MSSSVHLTVLHEADDASSAVAVGAVGSRPSSRPSSRPESIANRLENTANGVSAANVESADARLRRIVRTEYAFLWRSLRRLGVRESDVDDAAQRVLGVLARRIADVAPASEKSFVFQTAVRVASEFRRGASRARVESNEDAVSRAADSALSPEQALAKKEARATLDEILDALEIDLRAVFVLFEIEEMGTTEIATLLEIPPGTVSSRLRRAREQFTTIAARFRAQASMKVRP